MSSKAAAPTEKLTTAELLELFYLSAEFMCDEEEPASSGIMKVTIVRRCKHEDCTYEEREQLDNKVHYSNAGDFVKSICVNGFLPTGHGLNTKLFYSPCPWTPSHA